jgi:hypothetical protein
MFTPDPIPRPAGPPASSAPLRDYFASPRPGTDAGYAVLPRSLVEAMPLPWQQHLTYLLSEFHQAFSHVTWPIYRVVPSRYEKLVDLDEDQLAEVGCLVEIDASGELVYRERGGRVIENPAERTVLVSCLDPIPPPRAAAPPSPPPSAPPPPSPPSVEQRDFEPPRFEPPHFEPPHFEPPHFEAPPFEPPHFEPPPDSSHTPPWLNRDR